MEFTGIREVLILTQKDNKLSALGASKVGDRSALGIKIVRPREFEKRMYFDNETGRLLSVETILRPKEIMTQLFQEHVLIQDIAIPRRQVTLDSSLVGKRFEFELVEFRVADKFDEKLFEKP